VLAAKSGQLNSIHMWRMLNTHMLIVPPFTSTTLHSCTICPPPTLEWMPLLEMMTFVPGCTPVALGVWLGDGVCDGVADGVLLGDGVWDGVAEGVCDGVCDGVALGEGVCDGV